MKDDLRILSRQLWPWTKEFVLWSLVTIGWGVIVIAIMALVMP